MSFSDVWSKAVVTDPFNSGEVQVKGQVEAGGMWGSQGLCAQWSASDTEILSSIWLGGSVHWTIMIFIFS